MEPCGVTTFGKVGKKKKWEIMSPFPRSVSLIIVRTQDPNINFKTYMVVNLKKMKLFYILSKIYLFLEWIGEIIEIIELIIFH